MFPHNSKILVVDDDLLCRSSITDCLEELGYSNITLASDGLKALRVIASANKDENKQDFDLIISDYSMPNMDGHELLEEIRNSLKLKTLPYILVTSVDDMTRVMTIILAGVDQYIVKPIHPDLLREKLEATWAKVHQS